MALKNTLVSIVVPVYNNEKYVKQCVDTIINQTYKNIEIILVDDGSIDSTPKLLDEIKKNDKRVIVIHQKNSGVSTARNNGIKYSKGEYVTFIDSDDYVEEDYIEYLYNLIKNNNADISLTPFPNKIIGNGIVSNPTDISDKTELWSSEESVINMFHYKVVISSWNKMFSKELLEKHKVFFNEGLAFGEGYDFTISAFQKAKCIAVGYKRIYDYRVDNVNSVMTKFSLRQVTGSIDAQNTIKNNLINPTANILKAWKYSNWHTYCDCLNSIIGCKKQKELYETYLEIKKICRKYALNALNAPVSLKEKLKAVLFFISPTLASMIINRLRVRKFNN